MKLLFIKLFLNEKKNHVKNVIKTFIYKGKKKKNIS